MRNIINISLPKELAESARKEVKRDGYASLSEFFRHLLRIHNLAKQLKRAREDFDKGKNWEILRSLKDLE